MYMPQVCMINEPLHSFTNTSTLRLQLLPTHTNACPPPIYTCPNTHHAPISCTHVKQRIPGPTLREFQHPGREAQACLQR